MYIYIYGINLQKFSTDRNLFINFTLHNNFCIHLHFIYCYRYSDPLPFYFHLFPFQGYDMYLIIYKIPSDII